MDFIDPIQKTSEKNKKILTIMWTRTTTLMWVFM